MNHFKIKYPTASKQADQKKIKITGTSFEFPSLVVDLEYSRRVGGKRMEIAAHLFESVEMLDKEQALGITNVPGIHVIVEKAATGNGTIVRSASLQEAIVLPTTPFVISEAFAFEVVKLVYEQSGFITEPIAE